MFQRQGSHQIDEAPFVTVAHRDQPAAQLGLKAGEIGRHDRSMGTVREQRLQMSDAGGF